MQHNILTLDIAGQPWDWLSIEDAAYYVATNKVAWTLGEDAIRLRGGINARGERSILEIPPIIALARSEARVRHAKAILPLGKDNTLLYKRDRGICAYCGDHVRPSEVTRDHVVPRCQGGKDVWENVVLAHKGCNQAKGGRDPEQANMPLIFIPYAPNRWEHFVLSGRRVLASQMDFLAQHLPAHSRVRQ